MTDTHSTDSSLREKIIEHIFVGELLRFLWCRERRDIDLLRAEVDRGGYDIAIECNGTLRHIQLKASHRDSTVAKVNVNTSLTSKASGCIVWIQFNAATMELGPFLWFGGECGNPIPDLGDRIARHTRAGKSGVRSARPRIREITKSRFQRMETIQELANVLFDV